MMRVLGRKEEYTEYLDGESTYDYVHKDKIRDLIKWLENDQKIYPDYWQEAIDRLKVLIDS